MDKQEYHTKRRRLDQLINATVARLRVGAQQRSVQQCQRAAEDLAQAVDELLDIVGGHQLSAPTTVDCPDCGQIVRGED